MERIQYLIKHPFEVKISDIPLIQSELEEYPYFPTLHSLLLFGLKQANHPSYQEELKKSSIYVPSRVALYYYLGKDKLDKDKVTKIVEEQEPKNTLNESVVSQESVKENNIEEKHISKEKIGEELIETHAIEQEKPTIKIKNTAAYSFTEWLLASKTKPEENISERDIKFQLIDDFLEKSPKITPQKDTVTQSTPTNLNNNQEEYSDLMTETLAQVYTSQKKYDKAIRAYKILSLKYPEKSTFFANRIKDVEDLKNKK